ncbi:hypothetical protein EVAR_98397_1 [Eumeta japonica]|uniref:C2H2-type domain-containing protein n=1 Tax=Eumeta variegata TaxID=151549 RepID=A0A4C1XT25_EUMVA|nr:hypothetical protein EVAR_98397_1 [Eumeta japonica]
MSTLEKNQLWSGLTENSLDSKYEKCRNITEEIYKRINITFEIKKLEEPQSDDHSDLSEQIDSNELSNETDLFAYDKSDSISSSISDLDSKSCQKYINLNNNEETSKFRRSVPIFRPSRPKKKFRKRIKKRQQKDKSETDGSSDEGLPLSRIVDINTIKSNDNSCDANKSPAPESTVACSNLERKNYFNGVDGSDAKKDTFNSATPKEKIDEPDNIVDPNGTVKNTDSQQEKSEQSFKFPENSKVLLDSKIVLEPLNLSVLNNEQKVKSSTNADWKCVICQAAFKGERGLRRHMSTSHSVTGEEKSIQPNTQKEGVVKSTVKRLLWSCRCSWMATITCSGILPASLP